MSYFTYKGILASLGVTENNTKFSQDVIDHLITTQPIVPIKINFGDRIIGSSKSFESDENGSVLCTFEVNIPDLEKLNLFVVPRGSVRITDIKTDENGITIIEKMELLDLAITSVPSDPSLKKIEKE